MSSRRDPVWDGPGLGAVELGMSLHAAAARRRLGEHVAGGKGETLIRQADAWMAGQRIRNPARMASMLVPGSSESLG